MKKKSPPDLLISVIPHSQKWYSYTLLFFHLLQECYILKVVACLIASAEHWQMEMNEVQSIFFVCLRILGCKLLYFSFSVLHTTKTHISRTKRGACMFACIELDLLLQPFKGLLNTFIASKVLPVLPLLIGVFQTKSGLYRKHGTNDVTLSQHR